MKADDEMVRDQGKWWINKRGAVCIKWKRWGKARKRCRKLATNGKLSLGRHPRTGKKFKKGWLIKSLGPKGRSVIEALLP